MCKDNSKRVVDESSTHLAYSSFRLGRGCRHMIIQTQELVCEQAPLQILELDNRLARRLHAKKYNLL